MKAIFSVFVIIMGITGIMIAGCAQKKVVAPETQPQVTQPQEGVSESKKSPENITEQKVAKVESKEVPVKGEEVSGMFADVYFDFDKYEINGDAEPIVKAVADYLIKNSTQRVLIEGNCDERGTSEYNLGLGDRRAKATKDYLISLGVSSSRIDTISYGKERPLCTEHTEDCWAKNRRAHFVLIKKVH